VPAARRLPASPLAGLSTWILLAWVLTACGGDLYVNPSYRYLRSAPPRLAIIPLPLNLGPGDASVTESFSDAPQRVTLAPVNGLRQTIGSDAPLTDTLNRIIKKEYTKSELKESASLTDLLGSTELLRLREWLAAADLMLIPVDFAVTSAAGHTFGLARFRLFDLHSGSLIYENSTKINVNLTGEQGVLLMNHLLLGYVRSDFDRHFLKAR